MLSEKLTSLKSGSNKDEEIENLYGKVNIDQILGQYDISDEEIAIKK